MILLLKIIKKRFKNKGNGNFQEISVQHISIIGGDLTELNKKKRRKDSEYISHVHKCIWKRQGRIKFYFTFIFRNRVRMSLNIIDGVSNFYSGRGM